MHLPLPLAIGSLALGFSANSLAQVQNLGATPGASFRATLISGDGNVVAGVAKGPAGGTHIAVWTEGAGLRQLEDASNLYFAPDGLSDDGRFLVGAKVTSQSQEPQLGARWDLTTDQRIDIAPFPGDFRSSADWVSADGSVVAGSSFGGFGGERTYRWEASTGAVDIGSLGGADTKAHGMNLDGSTIVGGSSDAAGRRRAFRWTEATGIVEIPGLGDFDSVALDVSDDGLATVGKTANPAFPSGAFFHFVGLGTIELQLNGDSVPAGAALMAISGDGLSVVGPVQGPGQGRRGFLWTLGGGSQLLDDTMHLIPRAVSADGNVVAGTARMSADPSDTQAFRWDAGDGLHLLESLHGGEASAVAAMDADGSSIVGRGETERSRVEGALWRSSRILGQSFCGPAVPNSQGVSASMALSGTNSISEARLVLRANDVPQGSLGFFLVSDAPGFTFPVLGSQGALCLSGNIGRFIGPGQVITVSFFGLFLVVVDPANLPGPQGAFSATYGQSLYFQAWYRDANPSGTSNFSDGATVRFY